MPDPLTIVTVAAPLITGAMGNKAASDASKRASEAQVQGAQMGIDETRRQFDVMQEILAPYTQAGVSSMEAQRDIMGLNGPEAQQSAYDRIEQGPAFQTMARQGEEAILQRASATGGIRGGNVQRSLSEYRPGLLDQYMEREFGRLGEMTRVGQASATGQAVGAQNVGTQVSGLYSDIGAAQAGGHLAEGQAQVNNWGNVSTAMGMIPWERMFGKPVAQPSTPYVPTPSSPHGAI